MNNMNPRCRGRGRGGYNRGHPRVQGPNNNIYAQPRNIIQLNTHDGYNGNTNTHYPPPTAPPLPPPTPSSNNGISGRTNGYSNGNYVVTHRVQQQYSVQVVNPMEPQHHRQPPIYSNNAARAGDLTFPKQQVSLAAPPLNNNVEEIQEASSLATASAVVPYNNVNGANGSASNIPVSTLAPPESSPAKPTPTEAHIIENGGFISPRSKLEELHKNLGKEIAVEKAEKDQLKIALESYIVGNAKLQAQIKELQYNAAILEQEKDNQSRNYAELIEHEREEAGRARQDLFTWRDNAISFSEQLDTLKDLQSDKDKKIASLETQIADIKGENNGHMQRIRQLEQTEKSYVAEIHAKNNAIEQYKVEIKKKNDDLVKIDLRLKDKMKEMKEMDDELSTLRREYYMEILEVKKQVHELEGSVTDWKNKYTTASEAAEGYKADKKKLEGDKAKLENTINEKNKCIERKDDEILELTEQRNSLQTDKTATDKMLQEQTDKTEALKAEKNELLEKIQKLAADLETEKETKNKILEEHLDFYRRPTLLNHLVHQKIQTPSHSHLAPLLGLQPQLSLTGCSSPEAAEEVPEPGCIDERLEHCHEDTHENGRKRKHSASSSGSNEVVRQKDQKISGDSASKIEQRNEKNDPGSSQMKGQEEGGGGYVFRQSTRRNSHGSAPSSANNIPVQTKSERSNSSSVNGAARSDKVRKTSKQEAKSCRVEIKSPIVNIKKKK